MKVQPAKKFSNKNFLSLIEFHFDIYQLIKKDIFEIILTKTLKQTKRLLLKTSQIFRVIYIIIFVRKSRF